MQERTAAEGCPYKRLLSLYTAKSNGSLFGEPLLQSDINIEL